VTKVGFFGVFILIATIIGLSIVKNLTIETVSITVLEKERIVENDDGNISSKYLVFTDAEVFENTDTIFHFKFNSSDIQRDLRINETYTVEVVGFRVPFLSWYRNIIRIVN